MVLDDWEREMLNEHYDRCVNKSFYLHSAHITVYF